MTELPCGGDRFTTVYICVQSLRMAECMAEVDMLLDLINKFAWE